MVARNTSNYYTLLDVSPSATIRDIHKAYWRKAARCHPDKGGSHEAMLQIVDAWKILSDPQKRSYYDQLVTYRREDGRSRRFNSDRVKGRNQTKNNSIRSWAEFEIIYQKALYSFNQDLYGVGGKEMTAASSSHAMRSDVRKNSSHFVQHDQPGCSFHTHKKTLFRQLVTSLLLFVVMLSMALFYRNYSNTERTVSLKHLGGCPVLTIGTTTGTVCSVDKIGLHLQKDMHIKD